MRIVSTRNLLASALLAAAAGAGLLAQDSAHEQDFQQTVARVAWLTGESSLQRGDDPDQWLPLAVNVPLTIGDRVYASPSGRLEVEAPGLRAFVAPGTEFTTLNLTDDVQQYSISQGTATFRISHRDDEDVIEIDTPNAAVTLEATGLYRVSVDEDGNTRVSVRRGEARVAAGGGEVSLRSGEEMHVDGLDTPEYDVFALAANDSWDSWVDSREKRRRSVTAYDYTSDDILGASDLDASGRWQDIPEYGHVWAPANVAADWAPYRLGRWIWQDPWGWTWVSDEPWGWAPYHYGRWVTRASRWYWVPVSNNVRHVVYAPALVAFVGGGPGWSSSGSAGGGYVGWFPLGPRDPLVPWWGRQGRAQPAPANFVYANRAGVTVVNRGSFVGAQSAQSGRVRDAGVIQQVNRQPVLRGPMPVLPSEQSIRPVFRPGAGSRPPERMAGRAVAARLAPPAAPPAFAQKLDVIRGNRGAPVTPAVAGTIVVKSRPGPQQAVVPIRPVAREGGRVELAPHRDAVDAPPPDPIRPGRRAFAPPQAPARPVVVAPPPARPAPAVQTPEPAPRSNEERHPIPRMNVQDPPRRVQPPPQIQQPPPAQPAPQVHPAPQAPAQPPPQVQVHPPPQAQPQPAPQAQPQPAPQAQPQPQQPERRAVSREPRRVAPQGHDPLKPEGRGKDDKDKGEKDKKDKPEKGDEKR